jgi:predicted ATPase
MASGEQRFVMLETLREYALERLEASGEAEAVRQRHAAFFVTLSEAGLRHDCLEMEYLNLRAALVWSRTEADSTTELRLVVALTGFWMKNGYLSEGPPLAGGCTDVACRRTSLAGHDGLLLAAGQGTRPAWNRGLMAE